MQLPQGHIIEPIMGGTPQRPDQDTQVSYIKPSQTHICLFTSMASTESQRFNAVDADLILRSKPSSPDISGTTFKVHKITLATASPVFKDMLSVPQPPRDKSTPIPVVDLSETAQTLELFLQFIYPGDDPLINDLTDFVSVISASIKYEAMKATKHLRRRLVSPELLSSNPFRVYAIAIRFGFMEEAKLASTASLEVKLDTSSLHEDLGFVTGFDFHRLVLFHMNRSERALQALAYTAVPQVHCCKGLYDAFLKQAKEELAVRPSSKVISSSTFLIGLHHNIQVGCNSCYQQCGRNMAYFLGYVDSVKRAIDGIPNFLSI